MNKYYSSYIFTLLLLVMLYAFTGCKSFDEPTWEDNTPNAVNISISDLYTMVADRTIIIEQDMVIGGYVTTSDKASNFYRTFIIEDASGGAEIMAGLYDLHNIYPEGHYITVNLKGCAVGKHFGVMQIGAVAANHSYYPTDYFASRAVVDKYVKRYNLRREHSPLPLSIAELKESHCGRLVNIGDLTSVQEGVWCGYRLFTDNGGMNIVVYTSEYADYASKAIPAGIVNITGILQYGKVEGKEYFIIKMRDERDCSSNS